MREAWAALIPDRYRWRPGDGARRVSTSAIEIERQPPIASAAVERARRKRKQQQQQQQVCL